MDPGFYALMGAAAGLGGVTRMTLTLAVILVEVTDDAQSLLPMMLVLVCAKISGDLMSPSFDDAMIMLQQLPYLEEKPPREFDVLTARDVMSNEVTPPAPCGLQSPMYAYVCLCMPMCAYVCLCMHMYAYARSHPPSPYGHACAPPWAAPLPSRRLGGIHAHVPM